MIFFSGWGILFVPAMAIVGFVVAVVVGATTGLDENVGFTVGGIVAAGLCWWLGTKLNDPSGDRVLVDKNSGKEVRIKSRHSLMFLPVQYWAFIIFAVFLVLAFGPPPASNG